MVGSTSRRTESGWLRGHVTGNGRLWSLFDAEAQRRVSVKSRRRRSRDAVYKDAHTGRRNVGTTWRIRWNDMRRVSVKTRQRRSSDAV